MTVGISNEVIFANVNDMFDAIRDKDGVLRPTQFNSSDRPIVHLASLGPPHDSPQTNTALPFGKQGTQQFVERSCANGLPKRTGLRHT